MEKSGARRAGLFSSPEAERIGGYTVFQLRGEYRFTEDSLLLASFAAPRAGDRIADLAAGCGVVGMSALGAIGGNGSADFFELNPVLAELIRRGIAASGLEGRAAVYEGRVQSAPRSLRGAYTLALSNPPYYPAAPAPEGESEAEFFRRAAKTDCALPLPELFDAARDLLAPLGRFCFCYRADGVSAALAAAETRHMPVKRLAFVGETPRIFLAEAVKGARSGTRVLPPVTGGVL